MRKKSAAWFVYMIECEGDRIYTGIATDVAARFEKHRAGRGAAFTRINKPVRLMAWMECGGRSEASKAEHALKQLKRVEKILWAASAARSARNPAAVADSKKASSQRKEISMSMDRRLEDPRDRAAAEKGKGHTKEVVGKIKQKIGHAVGDEEIETRGAAERAEGKTDRMKGEIREKVEDVKDYARAGAQVVKDKLRGNDPRH